MIQRILDREISSIKKAAALLFTRLDCYVFGVQANQNVWHWLDCLAGHRLPNRIYVTFVNQRAIYGDYTKQSTYLDHMSITSFRPQIHGRDVLASPIKTKFEFNRDTKVLNTAASNYWEPYWALVNVFDAVCNSQVHPRITAPEFMLGY